MKWYKSLSFALLFLVVLANAQSANRFFYELTFKPKKGIDSLQKAVMILDVTDKKSLYRDYLTVSQDSVLKIEVEKMQKAGVFKDLSKSFQMPKFAYKITKEYPTMKVNFSERMLNSVFGYNEEPKFNWKISNDKQKIGEYEAQKATTEFGGRKWTAWFTESIPFPDGPYKFSGLPGLIVKIEDAEKNFSWVLTANKPLKEFEELSYSEKLSAQFGARNDVTIINRDKFESSFEEYKKDPFASIRAQITPEMKAMKMPGNDKTMGEMMSDQEKSIKDFYNASNNTVEIYTPEKAKK
ncbi:GLPGLI family protein [Cloacibacterium normanense]|uniref:GLPGLI family protein n=1 Tax=Cloacibacterium normanense TaxID=237258 RepID=A0A1E5UCD5_9FLAO|nr:GLPGLI family protein [Cloacibacterium normanense]AZI70448.1 GLPGLI family protein [Cloacibacterium normanense]OEL10571.1 GLPGLI family protein [Cloacibacterium normanense]SDO28167.1 GLPGLI family protein [Cloacibacterium normanense]